MDVSQSFCTDFRQLFFVFFLLWAKLLSLRKAKDRVDFFPFYSSEFHCASLNALALAADYRVAYVMITRVAMPSRKRLTSLTWKCRRGANLEILDAADILAARTSEALLCSCCASCNKKFMTHYGGSGWRNVWRSPTVVSSHAFLSPKLGASVVALLFEAWSSSGWLAEISESLSSQHEWQHFCLRLISISWRELARQPVSHVFRTEQSLSSAWKPQCDCDTIEWTQS